MYRPPDKTQEKCNIKQKILELQKLINIPFKTHDSTHLPEGGK